MNNRQTFFRNDECYRQNTPKPITQCPPNASSTYSIRPLYRFAKNFSNEYVAKSNKPEAPAFNSRCNEPSAFQTSCATDNFTPKQNVVYAPRLAYQTSLPSHQAMPNFQISQNMHGIRSGRPPGNPSFPSSNQFAKIPCNLTSVQSSQRNNNLYTSPISNVKDNETSHLHSTNQNNIPAQYAYRNPLADQRTITSESNSNNNFTKQNPPVSNLSGFIRQPPPLSSNTSNLIRQPHSANMSEFIRPFFPPNSSNPNFIRHPHQSESSYSNYGQHPLPSSSSNPDLVKPSIPPHSTSQPPPNLPSSNFYVPSGHLPYSMQIPPVLPTGVTPSLTALKPSSQINIFHGPNLAMPPPPVNLNWVEENKLNKFMERFSQNKKSTTKTDLSVAEFRNKLFDAFATITKLMKLKASLSNLLDADENEWNEKLKEALLYKDQLTKECDFLSEPKVLHYIQERLKARKRKRELKKKIRLSRIKEETKKIADREELHQTIDKWLESIKEKNVKLKREAEMKKEADSILAEVRRKIHEAKRTIDKIKVFEKLRSARHANAIKKGLFHPDHDKKFQIKISELKSTLFKQLSDYESEEKALKVMLEAEQEGQLEEEALWRIKKLKTSQQRRQKNIIECLFGNEEEPTEEDHMFLFHQFHNSGNKSIENLVQIRHQWDLHLNEDGEAVPSQWVVPVPPSSAAWEVALKS